MQRQFDATVRNLNSMPGLVAQRLIGDGVAAAGRVVRDRAKQLAPARGGQNILRREIRTRRRPAKFATPVGPGGRGVISVPGGQTFVVVSPRAFYGLWIHEGTTRRQTRKGANRGSIRPNPFLIRALEGSRQKMLQEATRTMQRRFTAVERQLENSEASKLLTRLARSPRLSDGSRQITIN